MKKINCCVIAFMILFSLVALTGCPNLTDDNPYYNPEVETEQENTHPVEVESSNKIIYNGNCNTNDEISLCNKNVEKDKKISVTLNSTGMSGNTEISFCVKFFLTLTDNGWKIEDPENSNPSFESRNIIYYTGDEACNVCKNTNKVCITIQRDCTCLIEYAD